MQQNVLEAKQSMSSMDKQQILLKIREKLKEDFKVQAQKNLVSKFEATQSQAGYQETEDQSTEELLTLHDAST